ncbi:MAG: crossover junction endodeoxyribonuclease RuvC [Bdellovibrionia bacterium]
MRILGVDPGSRLTGYGCVEAHGRKIIPLTHGTLRLSYPKSQTPASFEDRLLLLHQGLSEVILQWKPQVVAVEKVFFAKNVVSALKLGQARGVVLLTAKMHGLSVAEYSATEVKSAITGYGRADKQQVAQILQLMVGRQPFETPDASDGLALAICHAQKSDPGGQVSGGAQATYWAFKNESPKKRQSMAQALGLNDRRGSDLSQAKPALTNSRRGNRNFR